VLLATAATAYTRDRATAGTAGKEAGSIATLRLPGLRFRFGRSDIVRVRSQKSEVRNKQFYR
jgi:hypothetical protein